MAVFTYEARDGRGQIAAGTLMASTIEEASRMLRGEGKFIVRLKEVDQAEHDLVEDMPLKTAAKQVKRADVIYFTHQMAIMIDTGVPLTDAIDSVAEQAANPAFRRVLQHVSDMVKGGAPFSDALAKHRRVFPDVMISLLEASEASGTMGMMLERISMYMSKEQRIIRQARGALTYPLFMIGVFFVVSIFLMTWVMPRFTAIYTTRQAMLPTPTQILVSTSDFLSGYWMYWIPGLLAAAVGTWAWARTPGGRRGVDWMKLNLPILRPLFLNLYIARATRTMGTMIAAGVSLLDSVEITKRVTRNVYFEELWDDVDTSLRQGAQLSEPLFASGFIPRSICQMIGSGEKSGRLGQVLNKIADFTESEFDETVKTTSQFIEPVMVCTMGLIIGFIAISLLLPVFSVSRVVSGG